jgi:hypothetical protein
METAARSSNFEYCLLKSSPSPSHSLAWSGSSSKRCSCFRFVVSQSGLIATYICLQIWASLILICLQHTRIFTHVRQCNYTIHTLYGFGIEMMKLYAKALNTV